MKRSYWIAGAVVLVVVVAVLLVPGVGDFIETRLLVWLAGVAN